MLKSPPTLPPGRTNQDREPLQLQDKGLSFFES